MKFFNRVLAITFQTKNNFYIYDTLSGKIFIVTDKYLYYFVQYLSKIKDPISKGKLFSILRKNYNIAKEDFEQTVKEFYLLKKKGFLKNYNFNMKGEEKRIKKVCAKLKSKFNKNCFGTMLTFNITHNCNLRCKYCQYTGEQYFGYRRHEKKTINENVAKRMIKTFLLHSRNKKDNFNIGFFGGEPLLCLDLIKRLINFSREFKKKIKHRGKITFRIITNGVCLNKESIEYFVKHNIELQISIDGPRQIHDANRIFPSGRGSFDIVLKNIKMIKRIAHRLDKDSYYEKFVSFNSTLFDRDKMTQKEVENFFKSILFFSRTCKKNLVMQDYTGEEHLKASYRRKINRSVDLAQKTQAGLENIIKQYVKAVRLAMAQLKIRNLSNKKKEINKVFLSSVIRDYRYLLERCPSNTLQLKTKNGCCDIGDRRLFVDVDGRLYICERMPQKNNLCLGKVQNGGIDFKRVQHIMKNYCIGGGACLNCPALALCKKCYNSNFTKKGNIARSRRSGCSIETINRLIRQFTIIYSILEECPEFLEYARRYIYRHPII